MASRYPSVIIAALAVVLTACSGSGTDPASSPVTTSTVASSPVTTAPPTTAPPATATTGPDADAADEPGIADRRFEVEECPVLVEVPAGSDITCGRLWVPENRNVAGGPEIGLAVAIVTPGGEVTGTPVLYLEGGPGGSALDSFFSDPEGWDYPFLAGRELVLLDQRGTGYSLPTLDCPEMGGDDLPGDAERACYERLVAEGVDLTAYNNEENAGDVADLRTALGIEEWDLYGISYGTRLALEVMGTHPDGVGAVVLDSPYPPNVDLAVDSVFSFVGRFEQLLADCEAEAYCAETYPDLADTFLTTVERLNAGEGAVFGDDLAVAVSRAFEEGSAFLVPWMIYEVAAGNFDALDEVVGDGGGLRRFQADDVSDSEGMYTSVQCGEFAAGDYERAEAAAVGNVPPVLEGFLLQEVADLGRACDYWNPTDAVDDSVVVSDIPTLILVGSYDTATPPEWADLAAEGLSTAYVVVFPGMGHSVSSAGGPCPIDIISEFLADPWTPPDQSCVAEIEWPYFE